jgi:predicted porin
MKKHLIAAAVAAAVAVPAMAQNVTISGQIEAGYTSKDVLAIGSTTTNTTQSSIGSGHFGTNQVIFSGSEDLGGGLKAGFSLNREFNTGTGVDDIAGGFNVAMVSLSGGFGTVQMGKFAHSTRDAGGIYRFLGDVGRLATSYNSNDERNSSIEYRSPSINDFTFMVGRGTIGKTVTTNADTNVRPESITSFGARGKVGMLNLHISRETQEFAGAVGAAQAEFDLDTLAAGVNLGPVMVGLVHVKQSLKLATGANGGDRTATGLHAAMPMGALTLGVSHSSYEVSLAAGGTKPEATITTLGARYALSKRTSLVGSYQQVKNSGAANALAPAAATGINAGTVGSSRGLGVVETTNQTASGMGLTVVHSF